MQIVQEPLGRIVLDIGPELQRQFESSFAQARTRGECVSSIAGERRGLCRFARCRLFL